MIMSNPGHLERAFAKEIAAKGLPFALAPLGADSFAITLKTPEALGKYSVQAIAIPADDIDHLTVSHRDTIVQLSAQRK
jgi:hypothetical protein